MIINHNISAINAHRQLGVNQNGVQGSLEKLSSGLQINRAGDDAAGLAISEKMRGQIRGLEQASTNAQDGISLIQTAEGALNETHDILQRMRELSVKSANDTNTTEQDRLEIQKEIDELSEEITRISTDTEFNTQNLLNGDYKDKTFHIGANTGQSINVSISNMSAAELGVQGKAREMVEAEGSIQGIDIKSADNTNYRINIVQADTNTNDDTPTVTSNIDADAGVITVTLTADQNGNNVDLDAVASHLDGLTELDSAAVNADADGAASAVAGSANLTGGQEARVEGQGGIYVADQKSADAAITTIDAAINKVSAERSKLGAVQNRLEHTINNLGTSAENLTAAESRIRDTDMAKEMMEFTKNNILSQAAQSMLAQSQQMPQGVLQLLQ